MKEKKALSRRDFLTRGTALLGATVTFPTIVPSSVFGATAPSNRITMAMIGMGIQMGGHVRTMLGRDDVQILAVCDVDRTKRESYKQQVEQAYATEMTSGTYKGCDAVLEYEQICDRADIDAVLICTPDHWHAPISLAAIKSGKDVFCEKPMTLTIAEGRLVSDACKQYGTVYQVGSMQRSNWAFRKACEIVRNGWIGEIKTAYTRLGNPFPDPLPLAEEPIPEGFDYDRWLGPTPWYPYNLRRVIGDFSGGWRCYFEYGSRRNGDWGAHHFDIVQWALGMDDSGPVHFIPKGWNGTEYQTHIYGNGIEVIREAQAPGSSITGFQVHFIGTEGEVAVSRGDQIASIPEGLAYVPLRPDEIHLYDSPDHDGNWIDCIKSRQDTICTAEIGHRSATICQLSGIAERLGRPIDWDPVTEKILNDPAAERWYDRPRRAPYVL